VVDRLAAPVLQGRQDGAVTDRVHLLGRVYGKDKTAILSAADIFAMPTRRHVNSVESFGIVSAEAAWCGVPSLAGTYSGARDFLDDAVSTYQERNARVLLGEIRHRGL
jgi:glycosyltransferase involved in cell wall biosynthesis